MVSKSPISELIERAQKFRDGIIDVVREGVQQNEAQILKWNADQQLYEQGENRLGISIDTYRPYSPITKKRKKEEGKPYDRVTLRDEGGFESSFFIEYYADSFRIYANDWKTEDLILRYGEEILGLNDENFDRLARELIWPFIVERARKEIIGR